MLNPEEKRMQTNLEMVGDLMRALKIDEITLTYRGGRKFDFSHTAYRTNTDIDLKEIKAQIYYTESKLATNSLYYIVKNLAMDAIIQAGYTYAHDCGGTFTIYSNNTSILEHYRNDRFAPYKTIEYKLDENNKVIKKLVDITKKILANWHSRTLDIYHYLNSSKFIFQGDYSGYYEYSAVKEQELEEKKELEFKELASIISRHFDMVRKNLEFDPEYITVSINPENKNIWHINSYGHYQTKKNIVINARGHYQTKKIIMEPVKFGKPIEFPEIKTEPNKIKP